MALSCCDIAARQPWSMHYFASERTLQIRNHLPLEVLTCTACHQASKSLRLANAAAQAEYQKSCSGMRSGNQDMHGVAGDQCFPWMVLAR